MFVREKVEALAARRLTEQQIADVLDIDMDELRQDRERLALFREAIRIGTAKGEAELRGRYTNAPVTVTYTPITS